MKKKFTNVLFFAIVLFIAQRGAAAVTINNKAWSMAATDDESVIVKPLKHQGKTSSYSPLGKSSVSGLDIWTTTQRGKELEGNLKILKAIPDEQGFHISGQNLKGKVLLYPGGVEDSLLIWDGDSLLFSVDSHLENSHPAAIMFCHYGASSREMKYLGGMLHLKYESDQLHDGNRIVIETDSAHMISGIFSVALEAQEPEMKAINGSPEMYVNVSPSSKEAYFPIPCGNYKGLKVYCEDAKGIVLAEYHLEGFKIQRGCITTITIPQDKEKGKVTIQRAELDKLKLKQRGAFINNGTHECETKDTTSLSASMSFSRATGLFHSKIQVFHHNSLYTSSTQNIYYRNYNREKRNSIYDSYWSYPPILELNPGENIFYPSAIVFRKNGNSETSQFVRGPKETVWLYIKTYTCDFDYKNFTKKDTLCGYVPEWKASKGSWKMGAESYIEWEFKADNAGTDKVTDRIKEQVSAQHKDNHLRHSLNHRGIKEIFFWDAISDRIEEYQVVKRGVTSFQAVTVYRKNGTGSIKHKEATGKPKKFTTDIIEIELPAKKQEDGSLEFTGRFRTSYILSFGDSIKFDVSYFNGYERGFIIITEEEYKQSGGKLVNISKNKHVSTSKSGDEFKCVIPYNQEKYYIWAYLQIGKYLFLSGTSRYASEEGRGIFADLPAIIDPFTSYIAPFADNYISQYRLCNKRNSGVTFWDVQKAEKLLGEKYNELQKWEENSAYAATGVILENLPYSTEEGLPYKIIEPIKYIISTCNAEIFEDININKGRWPSIFMNIFSYIDAHPASVIKQYPMIYFATAKMKIQILNKEAFPRYLIPGTVRIFGYVPGNGPDGIKLGRVGGFTQINGKNNGDIVDATVLIVGWGPREIVEQMQRVVFTKEDPDKDKQDPKIGWSSISKFPIIPHIDWMDDWYEAIKVKYHNKFKPSTKTP